VLRPLDCMSSGWFAGGDGVAGVANPPQGSQAALVGPDVPDGW